MPDSAPTFPTDAAEALLEAFDWAGAEEVLAGRVQADEPSPRDLWLLAMAQRRQGRFEPAIESFNRFLKVAGDDPLIEEAHAERLHCARKLQRYGAAEQFAREAAKAFPGNGYFARVLGEALMMQGRTAQAEAWLKLAVRHDPSETEARALLRAMRAGGERMEEPPPVKTLTWPSSLPRLGDARQVIRHSLLRGYGKADRFITADSVFLTLGSCFAHNLAVRLKAAGCVAQSEFLGEEVNSTYANRYLLAWIEKGAVDAHTEAMQDAYGAEMRERFRDSFQACDIFIFTLGLAPCFFSRSSGDFFFMNGRSSVTAGFLRRNFEMRSTSVEENRDNILEILASVRRLSRPGVRIVMSVSPVPLGASSEFASPVIADCISKSTLRIACHEALKRPEAEGALYWPSFEMVRWLGAHFGRDFDPAFGLDDGNSRHVSTWLVDAIIDLFLETFSVDRPAAVR